MQIVNTGSIYRIYDNSVQTSDKLPAQCYQVDFNPQAGHEQAGKRPALVISADINTAGEAVYLTRKKKRLSLAISRLKNSFSMV